MSEPAETISGVYEHRSGQRYLVLGVARYDATDTPCVVYVRLYGRNQGGYPMSVRMLDDFVAPVEWPDGERRPRFRRIGATEPSAT
jgi:hypothetical protein